MVIQRPSFPNDTRRDVRTQTLTGQSFNPLDRTTAALRRGIDHGLHFGAQVYVSQGGEIAADFTLGQSDSQHELRPDTLVGWLSASKPVTALAIAQLFEQGRLDLDDPVARHVPEFAAHGKERITLRHVLTHTGGFRTVRFRFPEEAWDTIIQKICDAEPEHIPGEKAAYHPHTGWFILGEIVQRLSGETLSDYTRNHLFLPLAMHDSWLGMFTCAYDAYHKAGRIGALLDTSQDSASPHPFHNRERVTRTHPGAGVFGPMRQSARLYEMLLSGGQRNGHCVLEPETIKLFTTPQRMGMFDHTFQHTIDWGLGFIIDSKHHARSAEANVPYGYGPYASPRSFGHSGWQSSVAFCDPGHALVIAVLCNGTSGEKPHYRRMHELLGAIYEDLGLV